MTDPTASKDLVELQIKDPLEAQKYMKAVEVFEYILGGMSVKAACDQAGISTRTYYRWVEDGIFQPIIGGAVTGQLHDTQLKVMKALENVVEVQIELATGVRQGTNFDKNNAARFLMERVVEPTMKAYLAAQKPKTEAPKEEDPAKRYLAAQPDWARDLPPGEKIVETTTHVVERQIPQAGVVLEVPDHRSETSEDGEGDVRGLPPDQPGSDEAS